MKNLVFTILVIGMFSQAHAGYLCSYTAYISDHNKYNSSGKYLGGAVNRQTAATILRQDRADVHRFGIGTFGDSYDCYFDNINNRKRMHAMLSRGNISKYTIRQIVNGNPLVKVDVYSNHINVKPY